MDIEIIVIGKLKEKYLKQGVNDYFKRICHYAKIKIIEVADEPTKDRMSEQEIEQHLEKEANRIQKYLKADRHIIAMAIEGELISSEGLAELLNRSATYGQGKFTFIIGGSIGLSDEIKQQAHQLISFGRITLPHQLMRLVLLEQIYRACRINANHHYHK